MTKKESIQFVVKNKYYKILKPFFDNSDSSFYVNQLKGITKLSPRILIDELKNLEKEGILKSRRVANAKFYDLDVNNAKTKRLRVIFR